MTRNVFYFLIAIFSVSIFFTGCNKEDDIAKNYEVAIALKTPEGITLSEISDLKVVAANMTTGVEKEISIADGKGKERLTAGEYNFRVSGKTDDYNLTGLVKSSVYEDKEVLIELTISGGAGLVFKEMYFCGVPSFYWKDGFYEIYNNSDEVQYLDGVILGIVATGSGQPTPWVDENGNLLERYPMDNNTVYFPGSGKGGTLKLNVFPFSTINLYLDGTNATAFTGASIDPVTKEMNFTLKVKGQYFGISMYPAQVSFTSSIFTP